MAEYEVSEERILSIPARYTGQARYNVIFNGTESIRKVISLYFATLGKGICQNSSVKVKKERTS